MDVRFKNDRGEKLAGIMDQVESPIAQAIFSHCFTCSKDHTASYHLCKALAAQNIQVLRFDFTGLGKSEGDFVNSNFSSNLNDIKAAVQFLGKNSYAPQILIGHSLGGIAAIAAACEIDEIRAVATIASPSRPAHVLDHFEQHIPKILKSGFDEVSVFDRPFKLTKEYILDPILYPSMRPQESLQKPSTQKALYHSIMQII
ncbi:MAG: alpha/beta fold hydrolase [Gammaproteobacteria bacterium]